MKAEIFYLENQSEIVKKISHLLKEKIYPGLNVVLYQVDNQPEGKGLNDIAARFQKLMRASIKPESRPEKRVELTTEVWKGYDERLYIRIYYFWNYTTSFNGNELVSFFPSVAVHDRMFMIPTEINKLLRSEGEEVEFLIPVEMGGAIKIDYEDWSSIQAGVVEVAQHVYDEFRQNLRASAYLMPRQDFSTSGISSGLGVDPGFIQHFLKVDASGISFYKQLTCEINPQEIPFGQWSAVTCSIQNNTELDLAELEVSITGPVEIRPTHRIELNLPAHRTAEFKISLRPHDRGEFPLELVLMLPDDRIYHDFLHVHDVWLCCT